MIELQKYLILRAKNSLNQDSPQFYKISEFSQSAHVLPKDTKDFPFYLNNNIE